MKFPRHYTVLDETVVEVETDLPTTIERLRSMQGGCRETDTDQNPPVFSCDKKGQLRVDKAARSSSSAIADRLNFVVGEVVEEDGKTIVKIYSVHDRFEKKHRYVIWTVYALLFVVFLLFVVSALARGARLSPKDIGTAAAFLVLLFIIPFRTARDAENQPADLEIMKTEAVNRVHAVDRWDE